MSERPAGQVCRAPDCRVLARRRIGGARVRVERVGRREQSYSLVSTYRGRTHGVHLGGDGNPGYGSDVPQSYGFSRLVPVEIDGDRRTPEVVVLGTSTGQPTAHVCRLAPTPCCLYSMVAGRRNGELVPPTFDGQGHLMMPDGPVDLSFCD